MSDLATACAAGNIALVTTLLDEKYTNMKEKIVIDAFHTAVRKDQNNIVTLFIQRGVNIDTMDEYGYTPFHIACYPLENLEIMDILLDAGAKVDAMNKFENTSLHMACYSPVNLKIIKRLLNAGANVDAMNDHGNTPLYCLVMGGCSVNNEHFEELLTQMHVLLDHGASTTIRNKKGNTVLDIANVWARGMSKLNTRSADQDPLDFSKMPELIETYNASRDVKNAARRK